MGKKYTCTLLVGLQIDATAMEKAVWRFLRKLGMASPFDPAIPLLSLYSKDLKSAYYSDTATIEQFIAAQFTIASLWNQLRCPSIDEWIKKL